MSKKWPKEYPQVLLVRMPKHHDPAYFTGSTEPERLFAPGEKVTLLRYVFAGKCQSEDFLDGRHSTKSRARDRGER